MVRFSFLCHFKFTIAEKVRALKYSVFRMGKGKNVWLRMKSQVAKNRAFCKDMDYLCVQQSYSFEYWRIFNFAEPLHKWEISKCTVLASWLFILTATQIYYEGVTNKISKYTELTGGHVFHGEWMWKKLLKNHIYKRFLNYGYSIEFTSHVHTTNWIWMFVCCMCESLNIYTAHICTSFN